MSSRLLKIQSLFFSLLLCVWITGLFYFTLSPDYTSGELLDHFLSWFEKGALYTSIDHSPYRVLNYPPFFFFFTLAVHKIGFSILSSGRIVTILFFLVALYTLFNWFKTLGYSKKVSFAIIALLGTSFPVFYNLGQWSLQWPAIALSLTGLFLIQNSTKKTDILLGGFFCALACFFKQTQVIPIFIALLWLLKYHPRKSLWFLITLFLTGIAGSVFLQFSFGNEIWLHLITYTVGSFSFSNLLKQWALHVLPWIVFFSFGIWLGFKNRKERKDLRWWYFIGTSFSLFSSARLGSGHQYFLEWTIATLLWIGPSIASSLKSKAFVFLISFQIITADLGVAALLIHHLKQLNEIEKILPDICQVLETDKEIPSENPGLIRACQKIPALQPFIMTNLANKNLWNQEPFLKKISQGEYPIIVLPFDLENEIKGVHQERWTKKMLQNFREHYSLVNKKDDLRIYRFDPNSIYEKQPPSDQ